MYTFRHLDASYAVDIILRHPDYTQKRYHSCEHVTAHYEKDSDRYLFRLEERSDILLDNEPPKEVMDKLMIDLGNAIYPLSLVVGPESGILEVKNFVFVKEQWKQKTEVILKDQYTQPLERYIRIVSRNLKQEAALRKSLAKNTFVRLFFLPFQTDVFTFEFENFPERGDLVIFRCEPEQEALLVENARYYKASILFPATYRGDGFIRYHHAETGDPLEIAAQFTVTGPEGKESKKQIRIRTIEKDRQVSGKKNFWSTLLE